MPLWLLGVAAAGAVALAIALEPDEQAAPTEAVTDEAALAIVEARCQSCHSGASAPPGVQLETVEQMQRPRRRHRAAGQVERDAAGNATGMTDEERAELVAWASAAG